MFIRHAILLTVTLSQRTCAYVGSIVEVFYNALVISHVEIGPPFLLLFLSSASRIARPWSWRQIVP